MAESSQRSRAGLLAVLGSAAFTITWFVLGFVSDGYQMWDIVVRPYSPIAQPISGLGLGSTAPVMNTAFILCGILISVGTWVAMRGVRGRLAVTACGIGMAMCGIFDLESILLHTLGFVIATAVSGVGFIITAWALRGTAHRRLAVWLTFAGPVAVAGMVAFMATFNAEDAGDNVGYAGLIQRILVTLVLISVSAIGLTDLRSSSRRLRPARAASTAA